MSYTASTCPDVLCEFKSSLGYCKLTACINHGETTSQSTLSTAHFDACDDLEAARTARVMTLKDVDTAEDCMEPVFVEMLDENGKPGETPDIFSWRFVKHIMPLTDGKIYVLNNVGFSSALYEETYNITWRCWTQRPTYEQRKAVAWDE